MRNPFEAAVKPGRTGRRDRVRLLVADQDEGMRNTLAFLLQRAGYAVQTAARADEVPPAGRGTAWDCLVTELELPGGGGLMLYARLLFQSRPRLPAIFLAGRPNPGLELGLREAPWVKLLRKPCGFTDLLAALEQCLGAPRAT